MKKAALSSFIELLLESLGLTNADRCPLVTMRSSFYDSLDPDDDWNSAMIIHRIDKANIPIILTAPHGGPSRCGSHSMKARPLLPGVVTKCDLYTMELLTLIDESVRRRTNDQKRPHVVAARFHRQFIDANRNGRVLSQVAYHPDCPNAKLHYEQYHDHIDSCIAHSLDGSPFSRALLLDIHGMGPYSDYVVVGTLNGQTCTTSGSQSISQPYMGFLWHLRGLLGTAVLPLAGCADFPQYSGGHTVARHGGGRVDALQLEFGGFLRTVELRHQVAEIIGEAILRTMQPMRTFLQTLALLPTVQWRKDDIILVEEKLRKAKCLTPLDIMERISCINTTIEKQGARKFFKKTLRIMLDMLGKNVPCPSEPSSCSKILPKEFIACNQQNLVITLKSHTIPVCDFYDRSAPALNCLSILPSMSFSHTASLFPSYQGNIIRRIFIHDGIVNFTKGPSLFDAAVNPDVQRIPVGESDNAITTSLSSRRTLEAENAFLSFENFLIDGVVTPAILPGFTQIQNCASNYVCVCTGNPSDNITGRLVTFSHYDVFTSKLRDWQEFCKLRGLILAQVPVLARSSFYGQANGSVSKDFTASKMTADSPENSNLSQVSEEYLYSAYTCLEADIPDHMEEHLQ